MAWTPRVLGWLRAATVNRAAPATDARLAKLEASLLEVAGKGGKRDVSKFGPTLKGSDLVIGERGLAQKLSSADGGATIRWEGARIPMFAANHEGFFGLDAKARVVYEPRAGKGRAGPSLAASSTTQWLERAVRLSCGTWWPIHWFATAKEARLDDPPLAVATAEDETWWDAGPWIARQRGKDITVWLETAEAADAFFAVPRGEGRIVADPKYTRRRAGSSPKLGAELDAIFSPKLVAALRRRGAHFDRKQYTGSAAALAKLLKRFELPKLESAMEIERTLAGLTFQKDEEFFLIGTLAILRDDLASLPEASRGLPSVPFAVCDQGTYITYSIDEAGVIYAYSDEAARRTKLATSIEAWLTKLLSDRSK